MRTFIVCCVASCAVLLLAQSKPLDVSGYVTDAEGAAVAGAKVIVESIRTGSTKETLSGPDGFYTFRSLSAGSYKLRVLSPYTDYEQRIEIPPGGTHFDVKLIRRPERCSEPPSASFIDAMEVLSKRLSGPKSRNCGVVGVGEDPKGATRCALATARNKRPFRVRYELQGIDSDVASGLVMNAEGKLYELSFDGDPGGGGGTNPCRQIARKYRCRLNELHTDKDGRAKCRPW